MSARIKEKYPAIGVVKRQAGRYISHFTIRAMNPAALVNFYVDVCGLQAESQALEDPSTYVTDGKVTLVFTPWNIEDRRETEQRGTWA